MCDRCSCVFVAPCRVLGHCVMLCNECASLYDAEICRDIIEMSWARAVSDWNKGQFWKDDLYGIPKKGGEYYDDVKAMMENSTYKKTVDKMMGKRDMLNEIKDYIGKNIYETKQKNIDEITKIVKDIGSVKEISDSLETTISEYYSNVRNLLVNINDVKQSIRNTKSSSDIQTYNEQVNKLNDRIKSFDSALLQSLTEPKPDIKPEVKPVEPEVKPEVKENIEPDEMFSQLQKADLQKYNLWDDFKKYNKLYSTIQKGDIIEHKDGAKYSVQNVYKHKNTISPTFSLKQPGKQTFLVNISLEFKDEKKKLNPYIALSTPHRTIGGRISDFGDISEWKIVKNSTPEIKPEVKPVGIL